MECATLGMLSGREFLASSLVCKGKVQAKVRVGFEMGRFLVPLVDSQVEDTRIGQHLTKSVDKTDISDWISSLISNGLALRAT